MPSSPTTNSSSTQDPNMTTWIIAAASGFVLVVLVALICTCYCRWKSKNSANVRVQRTTARHPAKQNHYASAPIETDSPTRGNVKKAAASQRSGDSESADAINPTAQPMPITSSTAGQTGVAAATDHGATVDALYSKVKKNKNKRAHHAANDLYSKPDKKGKGDRLHEATSEGGNEPDKEDLYARSTKQKRGKNKSENESETADELYTKSAKQKRGMSNSENESETADELYTKSAKQKRGKNKSENESETADELYTKPAKKKRKKPRQADYANYNLVKGLNGDLDVSAAGDVTQSANCHNGIMDNELYKK